MASTVKHVPINQLLMHEVGSFLRPNLALLGGDGPDQDAEDFFCYDVRKRAGCLSLRKQTSNGNYASLAATHASSPFSDSTLLFSAAMAQIKTPKTAFATTSATEYPICSPAVAVTPEIPSILMMYTKG